jgi:hypothetical protein
MVEKIENTSLWGEKPEELKTILRFNMGNQYTVIITVPGKRKDVPLSKMEGDFGESLMAEFPEGLLNVNSKRLRASIDTMFIGVAHKVKIVRSGEGYNTKYECTHVSEEKPIKSKKVSE